MILLLGRWIQCTLLLSGHRHCLIQDTHISGLSFRVIFLSCFSVSSLAAFCTLPLFLSRLTCIFLWPLAPPVLSLSPIFLFLKIWPISGPHSCIPVLIPTGCLLRLITGPTPESGFPHAVRCVCCVLCLFFEPEFGSSKFQHQ